jgi:predicted MPP superfamily phosphohydrolase
VVVLCSLFDVLALAFGLACALRLRYRHWLLEAVQAVAFVGAACTAGGGLLLLPYGGFGLLRGVSHALFCVSLPVLLVRALVIRRRAPWLAAAALLAFVVGEGIYVFAREVEPFRLEVTRDAVRSPRLGALQRPLRVACVADLQTDRWGPHEVAAFDAVVAFAPDLVLFLGDYLQVPASERAALLPLLHEQLARVDAPLGMFAVDGDVDASAGGVRSLFEGSAVRVLVDDRVSLPGVPVDLVGLSRLRSRAPFLDRSVVASLRGERFPIVIGHAPDFMLACVRDSLDADALFVAGHTDGGQLQVPGFGAPVTFSAVPRWLGSGGVFEHGRTWLAVSRGIGLERGAAPQIRLFCRPQLMLLELSGR